MSQIYTPNSNQTPVATKGVQELKLEPSNATKAHGNGKAPSQDAREVALGWVSDLSAAFEAEPSVDVDAFVALFHIDGWFRDLLTFSWDLRTRHGHDEIREYVQKSLSESLQSRSQDTSPPPPTGKFNRTISNIALDASRDLEPKYVPLGPGLTGIELGFTFETPVALGRGFARIVKSAGRWEAMTLMMMVENWKGYEEVPPESGVYEDHARYWSEVQAERRESVERDPEVLIVGAGQAGLQVAARFRQMNIRALVIEKDARIGDVWRKRYPSLTLHTPRSHHNLLYTPFPSNWPIFTPKDRLADWFEQYAALNELMVWTSSTMEPNPTFDPSTHRWNITIHRRSNLNPKDENEIQTITLTPKHLVIASGVLGAPRIPRNIPGTAEFEGPVIHSSEYGGGEAYVGKRVVVVGACNTAVDICQDLYLRSTSAATVARNSKTRGEGTDADLRAQPPPPTPTQITLIQRTQTCVVSIRLAMSRLNRAFPDPYTTSTPTSLSDLRSASTPIGLVRLLMRADQLRVESKHRDGDEEERGMIAGLERRGFRTWSGPDGSGQLLMVYERGGGFFVDVGCAQLIIDGKISVKHGVQVARFNKSSVEFTDGSEIDADAVIFATGWEDPRAHLAKTILSPEIVDQTKEFVGLDEEDEFKGVYKLSGFPGLWYACSNFAYSRFHSKQLGLFIQAVELGYLTYSQ